MRTVLTKFPPEIKPADEAADSHQLGDTRGGDVAAAAAAK